MRNDGVIGVGHFYKFSGISHFAVQASFVVLVIMSRFYQKQLGALWITLSIFRLNLCLVVYKHKDPWLSLGFLFQAEVHPKYS